MESSRIVEKLEELRRKKRQAIHIRESYRRRLLKRRVVDAVDEYIEGRQQEAGEVPSVEETREETNGDFPSKA
jgi:hypothetical protein